MLIRGSLDASFGVDTIACNPRRAVILSPTRDNYNSMQLDAGCARVHIYFHRDALLRQLTALLGEPVDQPLEFDPELALTSGYGRSLASCLLLAVSDLEQSDAMLENPIMMTMFEQFIITGLLLAHVHSCSERLRRCEMPISPRDVKRAIDYMESNLDAPLTLSDIVGAAGAPGRPLFKHHIDHVVGQCRQIAATEVVAQPGRCARVEHALQPCAVPHRLAQLPRDEDRRERRHTAKNVV